MLCEWGVGPCVATAEPGLSPEALLARWVPAGAVLAVVVLVWVIRNVETLGKPTRWLWARLRHQKTEATPSATDLAACEQQLRSCMGDLWVYGERAPLRAAEADSPSTLRYVAFEADATLLHPSRLSAGTLGTGDPIALADDLSPGDLFTLLDDSVLVIGAPGAGKSVLLWQVLRDRLAGTDEDASSPVPVLMELHRWSAMDEGDEALPRFEDFVITELGAPTIGVPSRHARALIARDRLTYLLDGLDELPEIHRARCLKALASFARGAGQRPRRRVALTCREHDYNQLLQDRGTGTSAVANALRITPFPAEVIQQMLDRADPSPGKLPQAARRLPELGRMLGTPLWLSLAESVYQLDPHVDPLAELPTHTGTTLIAAHLYPRWLTARLSVESEKLRQVEFLAATMRGNSQQTLYLETVEPDWLMSERLTRTARLVGGLVYASVFGLLFGLLFRLLVGPYYGLIFGLASGVFCGWGGSSATYGVVDRGWSWTSVIADGGPGSWLAFGLAGLLGGLIYWLIHGPVYGLLHGLAIGLGGWLVYVFTVGWETVSSVEGRSSSPTGALRRSAGDGLPSGLIFGLVGGLVIGLAAGPPSPLARLVNWLAAWPSAGPLARPANWLAAGLVAGPVNRLAAGLIAGLAAGLIAWLIGGLNAGLGHMITRVAATSRNLLPFRLVRFLNEMCSLGIMYPAGPGYRFRHRTLADHLADSYERSDT